MDEEEVDEEEFLLERERIFARRLAQYSSECTQAIHFLGAKGIVSTVRRQILIHFNPPYPQTLPLFSPLLITTSELELI